MSRFLADSSTGATQLCHTLVPNVTVDFSHPRGYSISLRWLNDFVDKSLFWRVYVHDRRESVLLNSYAIRFGKLCIRQFPRCTPAT